MGILNRILILTFLYEILAIFGVLISILYNNFGHEMVWIEVMFYIGTGSTTVALSISIYLMQQHNDDDYEKFLVFLDGTKLKYVIVHHDFSSINKNSNQSLPMLRQPLLMDETKSTNMESQDDWIRILRKSMIIICKKKHECYIDEVKIEYNYIKQGYTTSTILGNFA